MRAPDPPKGFGTEASQQHQCRAAMAGEAGQQQPHRPPQPTVDPQVTEKLAARLDAALSNVDGDFSVSVDGDSGMVVVRILDTTTGEIVKQVPPQELLDADISMERIIGLLVDDEA